MNPRILAIDCGGPTGGIALLDGDNLVEEVTLEAPEGFGHLLFDQIARLLARHKTPIQDIDCFAAASGPGSFTGLRVALAAIKGLADASRKSAVGVSSLQAIAWHGSAPHRACVLDARRGEIFGALYDSSLEPLAPEVVCPPAQFVSHVPEGEWEFLSPDFSLIESMLGRGRFAAMRRTRVPRSLAAATAHIARVRFEAGRAGDPAGLDANYVRRSDAERFWVDP